MSAVKLSLIVIKTLLNQSFQLNNDQFINTHIDTETVVTDESQTHSQRNYVNSHVINSHTHTQPCGPHGTHEELIVHNDKNSCHDTHTGRTTAVPLTHNTESYFKPSIATINPNLRHGKHGDTALEGRPVEVPPIYLDS